MTFVVCKYRATAERGGHALSVSHIFLTMPLWRPKTHMVCRAVIVSTGGVLFSLGCEAVKLGFPGSRTLHSSGPQWGVGEANASSTFLRLFRDLKNMCGPRYTQKATVDLYLLSLPPALPLRVSGLNLLAFARSAVLAAPI